MSTLQRSILIVDDCLEDCTSFERFLRRDPEADYQCYSASSVAEGLALCRARRFDAVLLDYHLPDDDGLEFLVELIAEHGPHVFAVVMITGIGDVAVAAAAMKLGAQDYLVKGLQLEQHLSLALTSAIEKASLQRQVEQQRRDLEASNEQLRQTVATLAEERALLARRVEERTADLRFTNAALARALRLKDEFLANMSHELRTPLHAVLGRTEALREEIYGALSERQHAALQSVEESGRHLLSLINDILDLSKIEAGKLTLELEATPIEMICRQSLRMVSQIALSKQIVLNSSVDGAVELIRADARRLKQILVNLLSNAVKFTPARGSVGLDVRADAELDTVTFSVWDTGIGIKAEDLPRLFQPFTQLDSGLSRQFDGSGLGLALVHQLVQAHGGSIRVESTPGHGSCFSVTLMRAPQLPHGHTVLAAAHPAQPAAAANPRPPAAGSLILLAEDNAQNASMLSEYLSVRGYRVALARDGSEAIARTQELRPELILMDIHLPGINGLEATRRIRADPALHEIPVIALTALAMPGDRERCIEAGADDYLTKPIGLSALLATIEAHRRPTPIE